MLGNEDKKLNKFLVEIFNEILTEQQRYIKMLTNDLTLNEIHVIEAVHNLSETNKNVTMSILANELQISLGSLTISTDRITSKGYLKKCVDENDKRIRHLVVTKKGFDALDIHNKWHKDLIEKTKQSLSDDEYKLLIETLGKLSGFLSGKEKNEQI